MDDFEPAPVTFAKVVLQECGQESCVHQICNLAHVVIDYDNQLRVVARERLEAEAKLDAVQRYFGNKFCVCNCYGCSKQMDCCHGCREAQGIVKEILGNALDNAVKTLDGVIKIAKSEIEMLKELLDESCNLANEGFGYLNPGEQGAQLVLARPFPAEQLLRIMEIRKFIDDRYRREQRAKRYGK